MRPDSAPLALRRARPADGEPVAALCAALSAHEGAPAPAFTARAFRRDGFGPDAAFDCLIAESHGRPAGYALYVADYDTDLMCHGTYLADLYVEIAARRCGIGRALMATLSRVTRRRGGRWLRWNVLRDNASARAFYRTLGQEREHLLTCGVVGDGLERLAADRPAPGLAVRQAVATDAPVLANLLVARRAGEGFDPGSVDLPGRIAADGLGARPAFVCHLAERDGHAVGYALHWITYNTEPAARCGYLSDLFVRPEHRRGGVARALMAAVARHWVGRGAPWIEWAVPLDDAAARRFCAGFAEEFPDVLPMIAAGDRFAGLADDGAALD